MKITAIKQQIKRAGRYSIFLDGKFTFGLSADALLGSKLVLGQELSAGQVRQFQQLSDDDKLYDSVLNYLAIRMRSEWEIESYLKRKKASPTLSSTILSKLSINHLIDDRKFAQAFVDNRALLHPTSRRKLNLELRQKHISVEVINDILGDEEEVNDKSTIKQVIIQKRRQSRYQDDLKLMQYLARQGFNYGDIKDALKDIDNRP